MAIGMKNASGLSRASLAYRSVPNSPAHTIRCANYTNLTFQLQASNLYLVNNQYGTAINAYSIGIGAQVDLFSPISMLT